MSMTYEEATNLTIGDRIQLDKTSQVFNVTGVPPHLPGKIMILVETEDGTRTFLDEKRLHLVSKVNQLETLRSNLQEALEETVSSATTDLTLDEEATQARIEDHFTEEPALTKPARKPRAKKK